MGEVFLATDPVLGRTVAIKMLTEDNEELRERFAREARSAAALNHHNIVTIYDVGEDSGRPFIAMEYLDGETMAELIRRRASLTVRRKLELMLELCAGLGHAHRSGIVHRDIKPANLMITAEGTLKILDFGIARVKEDATSSGLTRVGMLIGSPHYMSPEQADGLPVDDRSDIFAVGSVFYELLTGERAFPGDNAQVVINKILTRPHRPARELQPQLDAEIERILDKALAKDLAERYPTLAGLAADVGRVRDRYRPDEAGETMRLPRAGQGSGPADPTHTPTPAYKGALDSKEIARRRAAQIDALLDEASGHLKAGLYEQAIEQGEKALLIDPGETRVLQILHRAHRSLEALQIQQWLQEAESLKADGALTGAERLIAQSLQLQPDSAEAGASLADLKERRRARERAAERARAVHAALARGRASFDAGAFEAAARAAMEALAFSADDEDARQLAQEAEAAIEARDAQDRQAADVVAEARRRASSEDTQGAIAMLRAFSPAHPRVTDALADIEQAGAERARLREVARLEQEELERTRLAEREAERREAESREAARREAARLEAERREAANREAERVEAGRREAERREAARLDAERRRAAERREAERLEAERREAARRDAQLAGDRQRAADAAAEAERTVVRGVHGGTEAAGESSTLLSEAPAEKTFRTLDEATRVSRRDEPRDRRRVEPPPPVRPWYRRIEVAGPLAAVVIALVGYAAWPDRPPVGGAGNQITPGPPTVDPAETARQAIARAEEVYRSGQHEDAIAMLASAPQHALIDARLSEWRAQLSDAERDRSASATAGALRKLFLAGQYEQALNGLAAFQPAHPTVTQTLTELQAELDKVATRVVVEARKKPDSEALAALDSFRPAHPLVTKELITIRGRVQQQEGLIARARKQAESALQAGDLPGAVRFALEGSKGRGPEPSLTQLVRQAVAAAASRATDARQRADGVAGASTRPEYKAAASEQQSAAKRGDAQPAEAVASFLRAATGFETAAGAAESERREAGAAIATLQKEFDTAIAAGRLDEAEEKLRQLRDRAPGTAGLGALESRLRDARSAARGGPGNRGSDPPATKPSPAELAARRDIDDVLARYGRAMVERKENDLSVLWQRRTPELQEQQGVIRTNRSIQWVPKRAAEITLSPDGRTASAVLVVDRTVEPVRDPRPVTATLTCRFELVLSGTAWKIQTVRIDR
jgi:predicted Ser/Thr protein kinase